MIQGLETRWRYLFATLGGLIAGTYIGAMIATIFVVVARKESVNSIDPLQPWFLRYSWAALQANEAILQTALAVTGGTAAVLTAIGVAGVYRGSLTQYDDAHFQSRAEIRKNRMTGGLV